MSETVTPPEDAPALCLCAHLADVHPWGPCLAPLCGCGWYRPDMRGWTQQDNERRPA